MLLAGAKISNHIPDPLKPVGAIHSKEGIESWGKLELLPPSAMPNEGLRLESPSFCARILAPKAEARRSKNPRTNGVNCSRNSGEQC